MQPSLQRLLLFARKQLLGKKAYYLMSAAILHLSIRQEIDPQTAEVVVPYPPALVPSIGNSQQPDLDRHLGGKDATAPQATATDRLSEVFPWQSLAPIALWPGDADGTGDKRVIGDHPIMSIIALLVNYSDRRGEKGNT